MEAASGGSRPRLAVIMPTVRFDGMARQALATLAGMAGDDICVHIGDNSSNPEKHAYLRELARSSDSVRVSCHSSNIGAEANWLHLVRAQTAPFICMAADDDSFCGTYFSGALDVIASDADCGAACGLLVSIADDARSEMPILYSPPERIETNPLDRVSRFTNQNAIAYAVTRTGTIRSFADYVEQNPIKCGFNDYLLAFHILSVRTFRVNRRGYVYAYDNGNWSDFAAAHKARGRFYVRCGLPEDFGLLERVHWAVANLHFFSSRFRAPELAPETASSLATMLFDRMMADFRDERKRARPALERLLDGRGEARSALARLAASGPHSLTEAFDLFTKIVEPFSPDLAQCYRSFLLDTLATDATAIPLAVRAPKRRFWAR